MNKLETYLVSMGFAVATAKGRTEVKKLGAVRYELLKHKQNLEI